MQNSDLLSYLPFTSAVVVGVVATLVGRNGWKWATLTFFACFAAFFLAITPLNESLNEALRVLLIVILLVVLLLARRLWGGRISGIKNSSRIGPLILVGSAFVAVLFAFLAPLLSELQTISAVREQYYLEDAVSREIFKNKKLGEFTEQKAEQFLNPAFLKEYNLSMTEYVDSKGYFSPSGYHWSKWPIQTKVTAILIFSSRTQMILI